MSPTKGTPARVVVASQSAMLSYAERPQYSELLEAQVLFLASRIFWRTSDHNHFFMFLMVRAAIVTT